MKCLQTLVPLYIVLNCSSSLTVEGSTKRKNDDSTKNRGSGRTRHGHRQPPTNTEHNAVLFDTSNIRKSGRTYLDVLQVDLNNVISIDGSDKSRSLGHTLLNSEIKVDDVEATGDTMFETVVTNFTSHIVSNGDTYDCNIDQDQAEAPEECAPFYEFKGNTFHVVVDKYGNKTQLKEEDGVSLSAQLLALQSIQQTERLMQLIPTDVPMKSGSKHQVSEYFDDEMGHFQGVVSLDGFEKVHGAGECAVLTVSGSLDVNLDQIKTKFFLVGAGDVKVTAARFSAKIWWDNTEGLIRSSSAAMTTDIDIKNSVLTSPMRSLITEIVRLSSSVKS